MLVAMTDEVALTATEISALPWTPMTGVRGVYLKTLWSDTRGGSYAGLMKMLAGACVPPHTHRSGTHHVWVDSGSARVGSRTFGPGAYVHVPPGVEHGIEEAGPGGCTLLYLYLKSD